MLAMELLTILAFLDFNPHIVRISTKQVTPTFEMVNLRNTLIYYGGDEVPCGNQTDCLEKCQYQHKTDNGTVDK